VDPFVQALAHFGLPGIVLAIFIYLYVQKDKELALERAARIADAKGYTDLAMKLQGQVLDAVNKLSEIWDEVKKGPPPVRRG
jgi:hypothetical protein